MHFLKKNTCSLVLISMKYVLEGPFDARPDLVSYIEDTNML